MAIIDLNHTIQKFTQLTEQSLLNDFEQIANTKEYVNAGKFKSQIRSTAENIYNGAKSSGLENEEALEQLEEAQNKLVNNYTERYKQLLSSNNQQTAENATLPTELKKQEDIKQNGYSNVNNSGTVNTGNDIDPEVKYGTEYKLSTYGAFYNGKKMGKNVSAYAATNNTYSMCDMVCQITVPNNTGQCITATLGKLQTLSYSIFQNKTPVRNIGNMNARDYVYGQRTIAGSLIFAVFNKHWLIDIYDKLHNTDGMKNWHFIADEIPPFDITISFANEYGYDSRMAIYGVRLVNEGQTMSINDIYIENTYEYVATDIEIMDSLNSWQSSNKLGRRYNTTGTIASSTPQQSETGTPKMQGKDINNNQEDNKQNEQEKQSEELQFETPQEVLSLTDEFLENNTESSAKEELKKRHDAQIEIWQYYLNEYKKTSTTEQYQNKEKEEKEVERKFGEVYSKQWDTITSYYKKKANAKTE